MNWTEILNQWGPFGVVLLFVALFALRIYADFKPHVIERIRRTSRLVETLRQNNIKTTRAQVGTAESLAKLTELTEAQSAILDRIYEATVEGQVLDVGERAEKSAATQRPDS